MLKCYAPPELRILCIAKSINISSLRDYQPTQQHTTVTLPNSFWLFVPRPPWHILARKREVRNEASWQIPRSRPPNQGLFMNVNQDSVRAARPWASAKPAAQDARATKATWRNRFPANVVFSSAATLIALHLLFRWPDLTADFGAECLAPALPPAPESWTQKEIRADDTPIGTVMPQRSDANVNCLPSGASKSQRNRRRHRARRRLRRAGHRAREGAARLVRVGCGRKERCGRASCLSIGWWKNMA